MAGITVSIPLTFTDTGSAATFTQTGFPADTFMMANYIYGAPRANAAGTYSCSAILTDAVTGETTSESFTWTVSPGPSNAAPVANNDGTYQAFLNQSLYVPAANGLLANDTDADGDTLNVAVESNPLHGYVMLIGGGGFYYYPNWGYSGPDSFTYKDNDGHANSNVATAVIFINTPPTIDSVTLSNASPKTNDILTATVVNPFDADGDAITFTYVWTVNGWTVKTTTATTATTDTLDLSGWGSGDKGETITVTVTPRDATAAGNSRTASAVVVNSAPVITQLATQNHVEGRPVSVQVAANDPDGDNMTYAALQLPAGLTMNATGLISGYLRYDCSRTYNVTITVTDTAAVPSTMIFVWNVADATIRDFKGTELNAGTPLPNSVTVTGISPTVLYLSPGNTLRLDVFAPAGENLPLGPDIRYKVIGAGADAASGVFASTPNISFTGEVSYIVQAGIDMNEIGTLESSEVTHDFWLIVISFTGASPSSKRVAGGPVESLYPIKGGEHFEIGGTFSFEVTWGNVQAPNSMIRWQLYKVGLLLLNTEIDNGWNGASHLFAAGEAGIYFVRFFNDKNNDASRNWGEEYIDSPYFGGKQPRVFSFNVAVSDAIPNAVVFAAQAAMQARFDLARDLLRSKDSADDWRASVQFNVTIVDGAPFVHTNSAGAFPDPVANDSDQNKYFNNLAFDVVFVNQLLPVGLRGLSWHNWHEILISYTGCQNGLEASLAKTLAHEIGHGVGLYPEGHPTDTRLIMASGWGAGTYKELEGYSDALAYDTGASSDKTQPQQDAATPIEDNRLRRVSSNTGLDSGQLQLPIVNSSAWFLPSRAADLIWIYDNATGHDRYGIPAHQEREALFEGSWRGISPLGPVKEHDPKDNFWGVRDFLAAAEDFSWNG